MMQFGLPKMNYSDHTSRALSYLLPLGDSVTPITECIYRVAGELLQASSDGVLLRHVVSGSYWLSGKTAAQLDTLAEQLPGAGTAVLVHQRQGLEAVLRRFPGASVEELHLWRFPTLEPPMEKPPFEIWPLDEGDLSQALAFDPTISPAPFLQQIQGRAVFGACICDKLEGTVGVDPLGSMAYLTVSPALRGQGVGRVLLRWMIYKELQRGHVPFVLTPHGDLDGLFLSAGLAPAAAPLWQVTLP